MASESYPEFLFSRQYAIFDTVTPLARSVISIIFIEHLDPFTPFKALYPIQSEPQSKLNANQIYCISIVTTANCNYSHKLNKGPLQPTTFNRHYNINFKVTYRAISFDKNYQPGQANLSHNVSLKAF